ncbi:MAG: non-canonical purine NTP diphosphatase [Bacteroidota bacterium]|nr:non-canonical purine NTP diphosphatase [Bacteroidota bacterium]
MKKLIFATHNPNKLAEIKSTVRTFEVVGLKEIGIVEDITETGITLEENALIKSQYIYQKTGLSCFADDTGLEVGALGGKPGVYSARYAGEHATAEDNIQKLLSEMEGQKNRTACFRTVISLILNGEKYFFEGEVKGDILQYKTGDDGFGYDPIFKPNGSDQSFAQMTMSLKNEISHRGMAVKKLLHFLSHLS